MNMRVEKNYLGRVWFSVSLPESSPGKDRAGLELALIGSMRTQERTQRLGGPRA